MTAQNNETNFKLDVSAIPISLSKELIKYFLEKQRYKDALKLNPALVLPYIEDIIFHKIAYDIRKYALENKKNYYTDAVKTKKAVFKYCSHKVAGGVDVSNMDLSEYLGLYLKYASPKSILMFKLRWYIMFVSNYKHVLINIPECALAQQVVSLAFKYKSEIPNFLDFGLLGSKEANSDIYKIKDFWLEKISEYGINGVINKPPAIVTKLYNDKKVESGLLEILSAEFEILVYNFLHKTPGLDESIATRLKKNKPKKQLPFEVNKPTTYKEMDLLRTYIPVTNYMVLFDVMYKLLPSVDLNKYDGNYKACYDYSGTLYEWLFLNYKPLINGYIRDVFIETKENNGCFDEMYRNIAIKMPECAYMAVFGIEKITDKSSEYYIMDFDKLDIGTLLNKYSYQLDNDVFVNNYIKALDLKFIGSDFILQSSSTRTLFNLLKHAVMYERIDVLDIILNSYKKIMINEMGLYKFSSSNHIFAKQKKYSRIPELETLPLILLVLIYAEMDFDNICYKHVFSMEGEGGIAREYIEYIFNKFGEGLDNGAVLEKVLLCIETFNSDSGTDGIIKTTRKI